MDLTRVEMLIGNNKIDKLKAARVAIIGLGGVGSYVAEALCRSGVGSLLLIDADVVSPSNINRQLPALTTTIDKLKTEVVAARLKKINPDCNIEIISKFYEPDDFEEFFQGEFDYLADAIDSTASKIDVLINAKTRNIPIISAMGTGNKLDPSKLQVCDISKTTMCPLAKSVRKRLKDQGITKGIDVVFSLEEPQYANKGDVPGSMVFVPASAGLLMASYIVRKLIEQE